MFLQILFAHSVVVRLLPVAIGSCFCSQKAIKGQRPHKARLKLIDLDFCILSRQKKTRSSTFYRSCRFIVRPSDVTYIHT